MVLSEGGQASVKDDRETQGRGGGGWNLSTKSDLGVQVSRPVLAM